MTFLWGFVGYMALVGLPGAKTALALFKRRGYTGEAGDIRRQ